MMLYRPWRVGRARRSDQDVQARIMELQTPEQNTFARHVRARVFQTRPGTWAYQVTDGKKVILADNTGSWAKVYAHALFDVEAARRVISAGHRFKHDVHGLADRAAADL